MEQQKSIAGEAMNTAIEKVLIQGDLSVLNVDQRLSYYKSLCASLGLNPLTRPFQYLSLSGKTVLYASKDCTEQLRNINDVSVYDIASQMIGNIYIVTVKVKNKLGRTDAATGAVDINGLQGEKLANAMMKAETKAKRRATLSICGLGILDESEIDSIPDAIPVGDDVTITQIKEITSQPTTPQPATDITFDLNNKIGFSKKYKDLTWREVPLDFLEWCISNLSDGDRKENAQKALDIRLSVFGESSQEDASQD